MVLCRNKRTIPSIAQQNNFAFLESEMAHMSEPLDEAARGSKNDSSEATLKLQQSKSSIELLILPILLPTFAIRYLG